MMLSCFRIGRFPWFRFSVRTGERRAVSLHPLVEHGQQYEGEESRGNYTADDDGGQRTLHFRASARGNRHRDKAETGHQRGHELWAEAGQCAFDDGVTDAAPFPAQLVDEADQHDAVEHGNATQRDEPDTRAYGKRHAAQPESEDAAAHRQWHADENQRRLSEAAESHENQDEDEDQPRASSLEILELPAKLKRVAKREFHFGFDTGHGLVDEAFNVAPAQVHQNGSAALARLPGDGGGSEEHTA